MDILLTDKWSRVGYVKQNQTTYLTLAVNTDDPIQSNTWGGGKYYVCTQPIFEQAVQRLQMVEMNKTPLAQDEQYFVLFRLLKFQQLSVIHQQHKNSYMKTPWILSISFCSTGQCRYGESIS